VYDADTSSGMRQRGVAKVVYLKKDILFILSVFLYEDNSSYPVNFDYLRSYGYKPGAIEIFLSGERMQAGMMALTEGLF
jgi:hypothetical protein